MNTGGFGLALEIRRSWSKLDLTTEDACLSSLKHGGLFVTETLSLDICPAVKWIWEKFFSNHSEEFPASVLVWVCSYLLLLVSLSSFFLSSLSPYHPANHSSSLPLPEHSCFIYCKWPTLPTPPLAFPGGVGVEEVQTFPVPMRTPRVRPARTQPAAACCVLF